MPVRAVGFVVDITDARAGESALREANRTLADESQALKRQNIEDPLTGLRTADTSTSNSPRREDMQQPAVCPCASA